MPADPACTAALLCPAALPHAPGWRNKKRDAQPRGTLLLTAATEEPIPEHLRLGGGQGSPRSAVTQQGLGEMVTDGYDLCLTASAQLNPAKAPRTRALSWEVGMSPLAFRGTQEGVFGAWKSNQPRAHKAWLGCCTRSQMTTAFLQGC